MYGKLFDSIFDSSIMEESIETRYVWNCMIALADRSGNVDMTLAALARRINVPLSTVSNAVHKLSQPDPSSRSPEEEGRRLVPIDVHREWGWHLVNRSKYTDIRSSGDRTTYWREQKRRKRAEKAADVMSTGGQSGQSTVSTNIEVGGRGKKTTSPPAPPVAAPPLPAELDTPGFQEAWKAWKAQRRKLKIKPYTERGEAEQLAALAPLGPRGACDCIALSVRQGWLGLFPDKINGKGRSGNGKHRPTDEELAARPGSSPDRVKALRELTEGPGFDPFAKGGLS